MAVSLMCRIDWRLTLLALVPLPIVSLLMARLGARLFHHYEAIQASFAALTAKAQETLAGIRVVKAHVEEEGEQAAFRSAARRLHREEPRHDPDHVGDVALALAARRHRGRDRAVGRGHGGRARADHARRAGGVPDLPRHAALADGRVRLGHEPVPARRRVDGPDPRRSWISSRRRTTCCARRRAAGADGGAAVELRGVGFRYPGTERMVLRGVDLALGRANRSRSWGAPARARRRCST